MNLHDHACFERMFGKPAIDGQHRQLDQICCRALHRRIDRGTFGTLTSCMIA